MKLKIPALLFNQKNKISLEYIGAFLLIVFCNFWLYKARPVIPLYYFYFISLIILFLSIFSKNIFRLSKCELLSIICSLYSFLTLVITNTEWQYTVHMATAVSCFVIVSLLIKNMKKQIVLKITDYMLALNLFYITCETYWRITHPLLSRDNEIITENSTFYIFKTNSFMISDSNSIALMTIIFLFLAFYLYKNVENSKKYIYFIVGYLLLTIFSFSRAVWIATFLTIILVFSIDFLKKHLFIYFKKNKFTAKLFLFSIFVPSFVILSLVCIFSLLMNDSSFLTKIDLAQNILHFFSKTSLYQIIFGIGSSLDASNEIYGRYPHNIILTYLTWVGLLGTTLVYYLWWCIYKTSNKKSWIVFVPQIFAGISYTMPGLHLFYVALALICYFENIKKGKMNEKNNLYR